MTKDFYGKAELKHYQNPCPVLALGEYKKDKGEDEFSRKQVWFYVYGEEGIEKEFRSNLKSLLESRFVEDQLDWNLMTLYPTHVKGKVNPHMQTLIRSLSSDTGIEYEQVLERTKNIEENHEIDSAKAKIVNLEGSIRVKDFEGENVILVDNISLTGTSMLHGANQLLQNGAKRVFGVCIGMGTSFPNKKLVSREKKASELV
jgi:phosphoribosylpyrophosphate synthetase